MKSWCLCFAVRVWADLSLKLWTPLITSQSNKSSTHNDIIISRSHFADKCSSYKVLKVLFCCKQNVKTFCQVARQAKQLRIATNALDRNPHLSWFQLLLFVQNTNDDKPTRGHYSAMFSAATFITFQCNAPSKTVHVRCIKDLIWCFGSKIAQCRVDRKCRNWKLAICPQGPHFTFILDKQARGLYKLFGAFV
jgi:hypothetical protein